MKRLLFVWATLLAFAFTSFGQGTTGTLSGTVSGPDGVLPGATVVARDNKTGRELTTTTNEQGFYQFPQLEFGTYTIRVTANGFKTLVANEQKIDVGRTATLSPTLEIGEVSAEVVVTAGADVITSTSAQVSNTVSPQQILSLPLLTRNPLSLTGLQAGVSSNSANLTTINGMRTTFTNITRDGVNIQDTFIRSNATDFAPGRPSVDDTGEFTISLSNQEADQGYGGAQIRLVTPRGTKDFHGALFAYNRNSAFAANSFFNNRNSNPAISEKPAFRNRNQFGGKGSWRLPVPHFGEGGPGIHWDKAFWFVAYEGIIDPVSSAATRTILSPSAQAGTFTYTRTTAGSAINTNVNGSNIQCAAAAGSTCTITNFLQFAQSVFPNGNIRSSTSPIVQSYLSSLPTTSNFTGGDGLNTLGYRLLRGSNQERDQLSTRIDVDFNERNSLRGIFSWNEEVNLRPDVDTAGFDVSPAVIQSSTNKQFTMGYRRVFTSNFIGDFQGGIFTSEVPFDRLDTPPSYILGIPLVTAPLTFVDQGRNTKGINYQANLDWILGNHTLKFGGQLQNFKVNAYNDAGTTATVTMGNAATTNFVASHFTPYGGISNTQLTTARNYLALLGGHYTAVAQSFNLATISEGFVRGATEYRPFRYENHAVYFADRWQAARGLTLSLGVRYEIYPALRNLTGNALEPRIADGQDPRQAILDPNGVYQAIGGNAGREFAYYKTDMNNFAPNLGVAWTPNFGGSIGRFLFGEGKTVLRAGYSHVFGNDSIVTSINNAAVGNAGLGRTAVSITSLDSRIDTNPVPEVPLPTAPTFPRSYLVNNGPGIGNYFGTVFGIDPEIQTPMVKQYSFGMQREIWGNMAFEVRYVGSRSNNLGRGVDLNQIDIFNNGFLADFERARANFNLTGNAFCTTSGCSPLQIFRATGSGVSPGAGNLLVGNAGTGFTGGLPLSTFTSALTNGTPADLALSFIGYTGAVNTSGVVTNPANPNNQPCIGSNSIFTCNPNAVPYVKFLANPGTGVVDLFLNDARYRYDSLQTEIRKRFSQGLYFQANYTYSKNLTDGVGTSQALFEPYLNNDNKEWDWQRADFDTTHVLNFNGIYQLPFGSGKRFLNFGSGWDKLFGGWEISGLGQWQSGAPITFVDTRGTYNRSGRSGRQTANSSLSHDQIQGLVGIFHQNVNGQDRIYWIDPSIINAQGQASAGFGSTPFNGQIFFNVDPGKTGNIGRTIIDGPRYFNINAAVLKNIRFNESMRVQLRVEAFNLLNNVNFVQNTQFANINSTSFGQITSAFGPREIQWAVRFEW